METNRTDKTLLFKGIKTLVFAALSLFMGPSLMHFAYQNDDKPLYIPLLVVACIICVMAVLLIFRGVNTIMKSIFKK